MDRAACVLLELKTLHLEMKAPRVEMGRNSLGETACERRQDLLVALCEGGSTVVEGNIPGLPKDSVG